MAQVTAASSQALALVFAFAFVCTAPAQSAATAYFWSTYPNAETTFFFSTGVAVDGAENVYASFVADHYVVKIPKAGAVTPFAGSPGVSGTSDGLGGDARFNAPQGLAVDGFGSVYVADYGSSTIRKILPSGQVTTMAGLAGVRGKIDGLNAAARFNSPRGVALDSIGNLYVTDSSNSAIRLVGLDNHVLTVSGGSYGSRDSVGTIAQFMAPWGIAIDQGDNLYVTDSVANTVRKISAIGRISSTIAGTVGAKGSTDGAGAAARFNEPTGIAVDRSGNLFVTDTQNHTVRRIAPDGQVTTIGGRADAPAGAESGIGSAATFVAPYAIAVTPTGTLYVADYVGVRRGEPVRAPTITTQPSSLTVRESARAILSVVASGAPTPTYQWRRNGTNVADATAATLTFAPARAEDAGDYTVVVANSLGQVTSAVATLNVDAPPRITVSPQATLLRADGTAQLSVTATGIGLLTYQWLRDGFTIPGATNATVTVTAFGSYSVTVTNAFGSRTSGAALVEFPSRLVNLSTSAVIGPAGNSLVAGVVVAAPEGVRKRLLIRAVGPSLIPFGITNALPLTVVALVDQGGGLVARNSGWATNPLQVYTEIADTAFSVGAFALAPGSGDSALLVDVPRGNYTVTVEPANATAVGRCLLEIYEVSPDSARLANLSIRGQVATGGGFTVGFVAHGAASPKLLVRATGPALEQFGVAGVLKRPTLKLFNGARSVASNTGWSTADNAAQIELAAAAVGAFPLVRGSGDSAAFLTLTAGENYTAEVSSADGAPGAVLIEIYQVP